MIITYMFIKKQDHVPRGAQIKDANEILPLKLAKEVKGKFGSCQAAANLSGLFFWRKRNDLGGSRYDLPETVRL
jgi:hypothetical protein